MSFKNCKTNVSQQTSGHSSHYWKISPVLGMRSAVYGPAHVSLPSNSLINFPAIVSHYSVISLALNNIFCPKKLSIQRVAVARFDSRQQLIFTIKSLTAVHCDTYSIYQNNTAETIARKIFRLHGRNYADSMETVWRVILFNRDFIVKLILGIPIKVTEFQIEITLKTFGRED